MVTHEETNEGHIIKAPIFQKPYITLLATQGTYSHKILVMINCTLPVSVEVQRAGRCGAKARAMYTFIFLFQKSLRISKVRTLTEGHTMNKYLNIRIDPQARRRDIHGCINPFPETFQSEGNISKLSTVIILEKTLTFIYIACAKDVVRMIF